MESIEDGVGDEGVTGTSRVTLIFTVRDTGQGMREEQIQNLFNKYSHIHLKADRAVDGTGLGMNIVQHLVKKMDGDISVESVSGKGTEVTVRLTQGYVGPERLGKELAEDLMNFRWNSMRKTNMAQITQEYMPYGSVLVVDDMETNLYVARGFLLPYGLTIDTANSGIEAVEKIKQGNVYDIVFMDYMMPEMDGMETVKQIREKGYTHPIVALTASSIPGQAELFLANGFDGFLSKPIDIREMNASLNKFVRDRHPHEKVEAARASYNVGNKIVGAVPQVDLELSKVFTRDAEKSMAVLQEYEARNTYESDDLQMYILNVHSLKSTLMNIGETKLSGLANELEQAGRQKNTAYIKNETATLLRGLRTVVDKLKPGEAEGGEATEEDLAYMRKMLLAIKEACAEYAVDAAMAALTELKQKTWPGEYSELLDTISEHLLHSDFDEAEAVCAARLKELGIKSEELEVRVPETLRSSV
jgi:CheY-like chemotaxis protein